MHVLVTRPEAECAAVATALAARGHTAVVAPASVIVPLPVTLPPGAFDAVLLTSRNAVQGAAGAPHLRALPVYAVGGQTATAARGAGFADVRIGAGDGEALAALVRLTLPPGARLLYLAGRVRKAVVEAALEAAGYRVSVVEAYDAVPVAGWAASVPGHFDACLHFSRRGSEIVLAAARGTPLAAAIAAARHLCLSEDVALPLRSAGFALVTVAMRPTLASLLQALDATLA